MDPLSITASIVGIIAAAGKVVEILNTIIPVFKGKTPSANALSFEVRHSIIVLSALEVLFNDPDIIPRKRKDLIQLDQLVATFTDGVLLFSELEYFVARLSRANSPLRSRIDLALKERELASHVSRMQNFRSTVSVILNILQCDSDIHAARGRRDLSSLVGSILESNRDLAQRLAHLEHCFHMGNASTHRQSTTYSQLTVLRDPSHDNISNALSTQAQDRTSISTFTAPIQPFDFERDLETSRVYRQMQRDTVDFSFRSSIIGSHAWSALSDISLSDISHISVIALPIYPTQVTNSHHYQFGVTSQEHSETTNPKSRNSEISSLISTSTRNDYHPSAEDGESSHSYASIRKSEILEIALKLAEQQLFTTHFTTHFTTPCYNIIKIAARGVDQHAIYPTCILWSIPTRIDELDYFSCLVDNKRVLLGVTDSADMTPSLMAKYQNMMCRHGFMLIYSITSRSSFEALETIPQLILKANPNGSFPTLVVGNHCTSEAERVVSLKEGRAFAWMFGYRFAEIDTRSRKGVEYAFYEIVREFYE